MATEQARLLSDSPPASFIAHPSRLSFACSSWRRWIDGGTPVTSVTYVPPQWPRAIQLQGEGFFTTVRTQTTFYLRAVLYRDYVRLSDRHVQALIPYGEH